MVTFNERGGCRVVNSSNCVIPIGTRIGDIYRLNKQDEVSSSMPALAKTSDFNFF